jgi:4-amino-4-deoxy-L-arabinose transferase-like glycosyltransferase
VALLLFLGSTSLFVAISRGVFLYGDDILMFEVTESIVRRGDVTVVAPYNEADIAKGTPGHDGTSYGKYGIGQSLVAIPAYVIARLALDPLVNTPAQVDPFGHLRSGALVYGTALTNAVIAGATVALCYLTASALGYSARSALVVAALLVTGTLFTHYAATFLSEPLVALTLLATFYGLLRANSAVDGEGERDSPLRTRESGSSTHTWRWLVVSGFAAGLALATRLAIAVALVPLGLWFLWLVWTQWRSPRAALKAVVAWGLPIAAWLAVVAGYNWYRFRDVFATGYREEATAFGTPVWEGAYGLLLSPGKGVFWYNPPLVLGIAGMVILWRRERAVTLVLAGMALAVVAFYARYYQWYGGGVWGPRFLTPLLPLLLLPAGELVERAWRSRSWAAGVLTVAVLGAAVTALGILVPFDTYVIEVSSTPGLLEDSFWNAADSPLVVHLRRLDLANLTPDIAAQRYGSTRLALVSILATVTGLAAWLYAVVLTRRYGEDEPPIRPCACPANGLR